MTVTTVKLRRPTLSEWSDAARWSLFAAIGGMLPFWGSFVFFCVKDGVLTGAQFVITGGFALCAASLASAALFGVFRDFPKGAFPLRGWLGVLLVGLLCFSTVVYGALLAADDPPPLWRMFWFSFPAYFVALVLSTLVFIVEGQITVDPHSVPNEQMRALEKKVASRRRGRKKEEGDGKVE